MFDLQYTLCFVLIQLYLSINQTTPNLTYLLIYLINLSVHSGRTTPTRAMGTVWTSYVGTPHTRSSSPRPAETRLLGSGTHAPTNVLQPSLPRVGWGFTWLQCGRSGNGRDSQLDGIESIDSVAWYRWMDDRNK